MKYIAPKAGAADEKTFYFATGIVENIRVPVWVIAFAHIRIFIGMCPVKHKQAMGIIREMRRHPIENHTNASPMQTINQPHKVLGIAKAACRRKKAGTLIAPATIER